MNETKIPQTEAKKADENNGPRLTQDGDTERATKVTAEQHVNSLTTSVQQPANQLSRKKEEGGARKLPGLQSSQEEVNTNSLTSTVTSSASVHVPAASTVTLSRAADTQKRNAVAQSWPSVNNNVTNASHSNPGIQSAGPRPVVMGRLSSAVSPMKTVSLVTSRQSPSLSYSPRPIAMKPMPVQQAVAVRQLNLVSSSTPVRTVSAQVVPVLSVVPTTQSLTNIQSLSSIQAPATGATTHTSNPVVILAPHSSGGVTVLPAGTIFHPGTTSTVNKSDPSKAVVKTTTAVMIASTSTVASGSQTGSVSLPLGVRHIVISCEQQQYLQRQGHHIATVVTPQQLLQPSKVALPQNVQLATKQASIIQPSRTLVHIQPKPSQIQQVPGAAVQVTQSLANIAAATLISVAPSQVAGTLSVPAGTHAVAAGSTAVLPVVTIANSSASEQKIVDPLIDAQISAKPRKKCNCSRSQCLKLYCECFANGEFCDYTCNCQNCRNTLEHEDERSKAIKQCLDRNPHAFHPKIGKSRAENAHSRSHIRGCNCKRSGCLKNYCECYEAKVLCTNLCRCVGCKNFEESPERKTLMHLADAAEVRKQQQRAAKAHLSSQIDNIPTRLPAASTSERLPFMFITSDIIEATCKCLLTKAEEAEESVVPQNAERAVLQEFGRCLTQIIQAANKANRQQSL